MSKSKGRILLLLTGSIACFKACALISKLQQAGFDLEVVATRAALSFVGQATLEGLTGKWVHTETFEAGRYMSHIHLTKWAELTLVCPATANAIGKFANGLGDDLVSTLFLATEAGPKIWIAPAMNVKMYQHPATQASLGRLRGWGVEILETGAGHLACGDLGEGRLIEPDVLFAKIQTHFAEHPSIEIPAAAANADSARMAPRASREPRNSSGAIPELRTSCHDVSPATARAPRSILMTAGAMRESIDGVRAITNTSSGRTGADIADHFASRGHHVTLLRALSAQTAYHPDIVQKTFTDFKSLEELLRHELRAKSYDGVIHLAAVSDFSVAGIEVGGQTVDAGRVEKIDSQNDVTIRLVSNPKLVEQIRGWSSSADLKLIAFKLTNTCDEAERLKAVEKLARSSRADWIVHNDLHEISAAAHPFTLFTVGEGKTERLAVYAEKRVTHADELALILENKVCGGSHDSES